MEGRHVDVTVISAEDLKKVNLIGKTRAYATAWIDPYCRQSTAVDEHGGASPAWNQRLSFLVPEHFFQQPYAQLTIEIYSKATFFDDKFVGAASIPVSEIAQKAGEGGTSTHDLRRRSGKVKGSVRVATRVGEKTTIGPAPAPPPYPNSYEQMPFGGVGQPPYPYPPPSAAGLPAATPYGYPPPAGPAYGQGYYQQPPPYYQAQPPSQQRPGAGGLGMGLGAGLLAGAAGGLLVGEMMDNGDDGGLDL